MLFKLFYNVSGDKKAQLSYVNKYKVNMMVVHVEYVLITTYCWSMSQTAQNVALTSAEFKL